MLATLVRKWKLAADKLTSIYGCKKNAKNIHVTKSGETCLKKMKLNWKYIGTSSSQQSFQSFHVTSELWVYSKQQNKSLKLHLRQLVQQNIKTNVSRGMSTFFMTHFNSEMLCKNVAFRICHSILLYNNSPLSQWRIS